MNTSIQLDQCPQCGEAGVEVEEKTVRSQLIFRTEPTIVTRNILNISHKCGYFESKDE